MDGAAQKRQAEKSDLVALWRSPHQQMVRDHCCPLRSINRSCKNQVSQKNNCNKSCIRYEWEILKLLMKTPSTRMMETVDTTTVILQDNVERQTFAFVNLKIPKLIV